MSGAGLSPAGLSLAGYGTVGSFSSVGGAEFTIGSGIRRGEVGEVRLIDPLTGDYSLDATGNFIGQDATEQAVYLALVTVAGSSAVAALGQNFSSQKVIGDGYESATIANIRAALKKLTDASRISIDNISVTKSGSRLNINVSWTNLTTNKRSSIGL